MSDLVLSLLQQKGFDTVTIEPTATVREAIECMNKHNVGAILVMDCDRLVGIFTERDVLTRVIGADLEPKYLEISSVMTRNPVAVSPQATVTEVMEIFDRYDFRHVPVVDGGKVQGMISVRDVSRWALELQRSEANQLRSYITGYPVAQIA